MTYSGRRAAAAITAASLLAAGLFASGAALPASAATPTCFASTPGSTSTSVKGFDIYEQTGGSTASGAAIDFAAAKAKGACFVYIKASGGVKVTNANFDTQESNARAAGLLTGTYHLAAPNTGTGAAQAAWYLAHDGGWTADRTTLPPVVDLEKNPAAANGGQGSAACYNMSPASLRSWILEYSAAIKKATSRLPVLYMNKDFWASCLANSQALRSNALFVASYGGAKPALPTPWGNYTFWQTSDNKNGTDPFPGDQDVFNGTIAQLQAYADPSAAAHDYTGDTFTDVLSLSAGGTLHANLGANDGTLSGTVESTGAAVPGNWRIIPAGDATGDGRPDLFTIDPSGNVFLRPGVAGGGFTASSKQVARGWSGLRTVVSVGDFNGDGSADLLARTSSGQLWLYPTNGRSYGGFATHQVVGSGFQSMSAIVGAGDLTGDGEPDLITRTAGGQLWIYPHTPAGFGTHIVGPSGFASANAIFSSGDFTGDGHDDIMVRQGGVLKVYAGNGKGQLAAGATVSAPAEVASSTFVG